MLVSLSWSWSCGERGIGILDLMWGGRWVGVGVGDEFGGV